MTRATGMDWPNAAGSGRHGATDRALSDVVEPGRADKARRGGRVGSVRLAFAVAVSVGRDWPVAPQVHDEMSYLLGADTFAHGRLSNPTPPLWEHFETFHELMRPTYASKYLPAQALVLAAGQVLTGYPIVGVWISSALMCAALAWMLLAWVRPRWALWGTLTMFFLIVAVPPTATGWRVIGPTWRLMSAPIWT